MASEKKNILIEVEKTEFEELQKLKKERTWKQILKQGANHND